MDLDYMLRAGQFVFTVAVGLFSISASRKASSKAEAEQLARRLNSQDEKILVLQQQMKHLPDSEQLTELAGELADLAGDMKAIKVEIAGVTKALDPLARAVERMNEYLLNNK
ncbi:DUF2730 family protein [Pseudomonas aeruginosa]|uniref:DUF2730 family protein n=1 Tax=Pseudomonas aeruginosa TaxID=287 RepID=UPI001E578DCC|nr:DUF2730 family protein [Pseudomonas aeruginosa]MCD2761384.1 DUF2730 domain-containing protein [Pseudomonas aeruginosa]HBP0991500.1 DUF2730 family protein [Pseudomonas aeruginosa]HBP1202095.1 DUF2730 family protein [Pseudomonas aeruginosa]